MPTVKGTAALTDKKRQSLKPKDKPYKVPDRDGMYVTVSPGGTLSFRYDYRIGTRRETLTIGRYDGSRDSDVTRTLDDLDYGSGLSLAGARRMKGLGSLVIKCV